MAVPTKPYSRWSVIAAQIILGGLGLFAIWSWLTPTLSQKLDREVKERFPPGTSRKAIEKWLKTQPAQYGVFQETGDSVGQETILKRAGLDRDRVAFEIRADFQETRSLIIPYAIYLYFYFGPDDRLIKYWIEEYERGP